MGWLTAVVILVMVLALLATVIIGQSKSNKEEDPNYSRQTGKKWLRLSGIYVVCIVVVTAIFLYLIR